MPHKNLPKADVAFHIPFYDVDMMEVTWHGHYVKYFELARGVLLDKIDYNYAQMRQSGYFWPVIDMRVKYIKPSRFNMKIKVEAACIEFANRLKIEYLITDFTTGEKLIKGYTSQVAVDMQSGEMLLCSPDILLKKLGVEPS